MNARAWLLALLPLCGVLLPARAHAKGCQETSDLVGERRCSRFGDMWSQERTFPLLISAGLLRSSITPDDRHWSAKTGKNSPTLYEYKDGDRGSSYTTYGFDVGLYGYATPWLYIGSEWAFSFGHAESRSFMRNGYSVEGSSGVNAIDGRFGLVVGLKAPLTSSLSLRVDVLNGAELMSVSQHATGPNGPKTTVSTSHVDYLMTTRFSLDFWNTPWTTTSLWVGTKPLHLAEYDMGITWTVHARPHDG